MLATLKGIIKDGGIVLDEQDLSCYEGCQVVVTVLESPEEAEPAPTMGVCGYRESNGVKYWKPNMASLKGELGHSIVEHIRSTPKPNWDEIDTCSREINERIRKAREDGTF